MQNKKRLSVSIKQKKYSQEKLENLVLGEISFDMHGDEVVAILGESGVGKSTLLRIIGGLDIEFGGEVVFEGNVISGPIPSISFLFQEPRLFPWMTVQKNVEFGVLGTKSGSEKKRLARQTLESVELLNEADLYPYQLSGGMARRVSLARSIVNSPSLLLLDEPFSALDTFTKWRMHEAVVSIIRPHNAAVLLITHDIDEALFLADRILVLSGSPATLQELECRELPRPRNRTSASFLNSRGEILQQLQKGMGFV